MARMAALIAQRSAKAAELEKLDAEIRAEAAKLAGVPEAHPETANGAAHTVGDNGSNGTNGHGVPMMGPFTSAVTPTSDPRPRLAPRKMELLALLRDKPEVSLANLGIRMYGNDGRHSRVNVSTYTTELKAEGYIDTGSRPGTFRLTEKGRAMCL